MQVYGKGLNSFFFPLSKSSEKIDFDNVSKSRNRKLKSRKLPSILYLATRT